MECSVGISCGSGGAQPVEHIEKVGLVIIWVVFAYLSHLIESTGCISLIRRIVIAKKTRAQLCDAVANIIGEL